MAKKVSGTVTHTLVWFGQIECRPADDCLVVRGGQGIERHSQVFGK